MPYQHLWYAFTIWSYASGGPAPGVLALPGAAALALLVWPRWRVPKPAGYEHGTVQAGSAVPDKGGRLPWAFWRTAGSPR